MRRGGAKTRVMGVAGVLCLAIVGAGLLAVHDGDSVAYALPAGFTDSPVASIPNPTGVEALVPGRIAVLEQDSGRVRLLDTSSGQLLATPAIDLAVCMGSERGLLGLTPDPQIALTGRLYVFYTTTQAAAPGGCVNRVSAFTLVGDVIDPATEQILIDNISSVNGNHNAGDLDVGNDGHLYIATGDAGSDPRGDSGSGGNNDAGLDLSLLNGKILRLDRFTGAPAPGNPLTGAGTTACGSRGNVPATPLSSCQEIFSWGLRNPFRFAFDPNAITTRFFINDVGQSTREEVNEGLLGANYGWNLREGRCPRGQNPPCAAAPPELTDPITDYGRSDGTYITGGAFVPNGSGWPVEFREGYLFADGGTGKIWLREADGTVDYASPFATGAFGLADMAFVRDTDGWSLYYTLNGSGSVRKISIPRPTRFDFDGDGSADQTVFRPAVGGWYAEGQPTEFLGLSGDLPVPGDYDADRSTDAAVYRGGAWFVSGQPTVYLGTATDLPVPGDYDGDGTTDPAVFRDGAWFIEGLPTRFLGSAGDVPVPGDYDGDGATDVAVFRPSVGGWYIDGRAPVFLGLPADIPVPADYNGDGTTELAVFRPSVGGWYVDAQPPVFLGLSGDVPVPADFSADGSAETAVFRPSVGGWYANGLSPVFYGLSSDIPALLPAAVHNRYFAT